MHTALDTKLCSQLGNELKFKSQLLAKLLCSNRCYTTAGAVEAGGADDARFSFDPRLLVFEFTENLMLREKQYHLVSPYSLSASPASQHSLPARYF